MNKKLVLLLILSILIAFNLIAQVTIGSAYKPTVGSILQLKENDNLNNNSQKGLVLPRVKLTNVNNLYPMFEVVVGLDKPNSNYNTPVLKNKEDKYHAGLVVYQIDNAFMDGAGVYVWDGTRWTSLIASSTGSGNNRISLSQSTKRLPVNGNHTLVASFSSSTSATVVWSSANASIAEVDQNGQVTGKGQGTVKIKATYGDGLDFAECDVKVYAVSSGSYKYRLTLTDKGNSGHAINQPTFFLTQKAIDRRVKQGIAIDITDLPIAKNYLEVIELMGGEIVAKSKWLNTVTVHCTEEFVREDLEDLPFVASSELVWKGAKNAKSIKTTTGKSRKKGSLDGTKGNMQARGAIDYKYAYDNINVNKGQILHNKGFTGQGIDIAVIDDGFGGVDQAKYFKHLFDNNKIAGTVSFVPGVTDIYNTVYWHGPEVLSCLAGNIPGEYVGTAPDARYWLLKSEDIRSEYPVEEDYWVAAAEFADSVGVDLINSSLGYGRQFTDAAMNHKYSETDGRTIFMSRGANMAADKGILVVVSSGNDGAGWVDTPGEALNVLTVGGTDKNGVFWGNSSSGLTFDGRIKPDVLAMGAAVAVVDVNGNITTPSGTSFSSPILCGLAACLWQAYPSLSSKELMEVIKESGDRYDNPVLPYGNGIANMEKVIDILDGKSQENGSVRLDRKLAKMKVGDQILLTPTFSMDKSSKKNYKWSTDRTDIVKIDENADKSVMITTLKKGIAQIKIQSSDLKVSTTCDIICDDDRIVRVLAIGNSFTDDAANIHLNRLAIAGGKELIIARLTQSGLTLEQHLNNARSNAKTYNYWKVDELGVPVALNNRSVSDALQDEKWDYISFQQQSERVGQFATFKPYIPGLVEFAKEKTSNPNAKHAIFQSWAFAFDYIWNDFDINFGRDQFVMLDSVVSVAHRSSKLVEPTMMIIPFGASVQNGRTSIIGDNYCRDGYHMNGFGQFAAACTWYEMFFGDVIDNTYKPGGFTEQHIRIAKQAAKHAVANPDGVTDMADFQ